jgi:UDP-N-acetylmuramate dehydrogenase
MMALKTPPPTAWQPPRDPGGRLRRDEPMARHTTWRVGGPADWYYEPDDLDALVRFLREVPAAVPVTWVGLGSNLLVRDGGIRGVVICARRAAADFEDLGGGRLRVGAGVACARIARYGERRGIGPAAFFAGIPGTLGGALAMNAGAWGGETWERVRAVRVIGRDGTLAERTPADYRVGYRAVAPAVPTSVTEWFVSAELAFAPLDRSENLRGLLERRRSTQPIGKPSCGSVFRNPPGDHAARLIEACGLKGRAVGGAEVSPRHANFIVNTGAATAADVEALMGLVRETVRERTGVELIAEVRVMGEKS